MNKLKFYLIEYPIDFFESNCHKFRMYMLNKFRKYIYDYEFKNILKHSITDPYYGHSVSDLKIGVLSPVLVVSKVLEAHFGFYGYYSLQIHGIDVDTQNENEIIATIKLHRPGLLIGKSGKDINAVEKMLTETFNKTTRVKIVEVKKDINIPLYDI